MKIGYAGENLKSQVSITPSWLYPYLIENSFTRHYNQGWKMRFYSLALALGLVFFTQSAFAKGEDKSKGSCTAWQEECAKSKNPKACFPARCGAWGEYDYSTIDIHEGELNKAPVKTSKPSNSSKSAKATGKKKQKKASVMSCRTAFTTGSKSPSTGEVSDAADICEAATQKACAKNSNGTGDGRYVTAMCFLNAAYKGNMAVNENKASAKCEKARNEAMESPSTGDVSDAADVCNEETQAICAKDSDGTGDGRLIAANCMLTAAHGGFIGVTVKEKARPKTDANLCGGKAAPRICNGNCYVNYECRNNKWEKSPIESCALCGDAAKGLESIDVIEGEHNADDAL
jgi:hypothetical protein